ncbi:uncharacterized protein BDZ99DRAFT_167188 [Mytilinidion resinicola]|uniref:Uncharacterized protein n=1 Tax=Mytilinidion resinicola TaxID=574789 RepID=A0A6A6Y469_9PEZI|nr:uncharacterized protein BDZ99DRAFT_167188 [Mytilinidion resinicola]KAF2803582.1 hypothetical protein BDZ99DRAFT_167188 [Mytilinidion resinicola]
MALQRGRARTACAYVATRRTLRCCKVSFWTRKLWEDSQRSKRFEITFTLPSVEFREKYQALLLFLFLSPVCSVANSGNNYSFHHRIHSPSSLWLNEV